MSIGAVNKDKKQKKIFQTTTFIIFWDFHLLRFSFHHKWNDAQLLLINMVYTSCLTSCQTTLRKLGNIRKFSEPHRMIAWCAVFLPKWKFRQYKQETLEKQTLNFSCSVLFHMETGVSLKYFVIDCRSQLWQQNYWNMSKNSQQLAFSWLLSWHY